MNEETSRAPTLEINEISKLQLDFFTEYAKECHNFLRKFGVVKTINDEDAKELEVHKSKL